MSLQNSNFESGTFEGWQTIGDASIQTAGFGVFPVDGRFQALITNDPSDSGVPVMDSNLEQFFDLTPGTLDNFATGNATEGSAIKQTFEAKAGELLRISFNFLTNELAFDDDPTTFNDFSLFILISPNGGSSITKIADTGTSFGFVNSSTPFQMETGYKTFTMPVISQTGTHTLGFLVVDADDTVSRSGLLIDSIQVIPSNSLSSVDHKVFEKP